MDIPNYREALERHETPLDVFVSRWEPSDSNYKDAFREDLAALIAYIEASQTADAAPLEDSPWQTGKRRAASLFRRSDAEAQP